MKKKLLISLLLLLVINFTAAIAQITVTGTVTSAEDGEPIPGASVTVRGTTIGTVTDIEGSYSIQVPSDESVLRFSFVGMIRKDIIVGDQRTIDVELESDVVGLDEVVVTGYGVQRRRDLTGSVSSVRSRDIEGMPVSSIERAIQGRAAGVQVSASDGVPGGDVSVIVRGMGSFAANRPVWIVDGVEVESGGLSRRSESSSVLSAIDFNDIESLEVLKDAAATAIYGARGANGVIIITTKRGEAAEKTDFNFEVQRGYSTPHRLMPVMDGPQWAQYDFERYVNRYGLEDSRTQDRLQSGANLGWYTLDADGMPDFGTSPHYDWQDAAFRTGNIMEARLTARGGDENTRFYAALSHNNTQGHVIAYDFDRSNFRLNLDHDATDRLRFDAQVSAGLTNQYTTRLGGAWSSPVRAGPGIPPINPIYTWQAEEAGLLDTGTDFRGYWNAPRGVFGAYPSHFINSAELDHNIANNLKTVLNLGASYDLTDHLSYRFAFGVDYNHSDDEQWQSPNASDGFAVNGRLYDYETTIYAVQTTQTLNYNNIFRDVHSLNGVAGFETWERTYRSTSVIGVNFPNPHMNVINAAAEATSWGGTETERAHMGAFSRMNYTYDDRYMLTLTGRYDASSRFGARNRWGFFPAVALGWRMSSEPFMAGRDNIDNLMVRLSYGTSGSDAAGTYAALGLWSGGTQYRGDVGIYPTQLPNEYLTWEQSTTLNLSTSLTAYRGRLNVDLEVFRRWQNQLLLDRPLPLSSGWSEITENIGEIMNEGLELSLNTVNIQNNNFRWSTSLNFAYTDSEILELLPGVDWFSARRHVGRAVQDRYMQGVWAGVNPADGRPMYYDKNNNITYQPTFEDGRWFGPEVPPWYGGLTNEFQVGNFGASIFFQYSGGGSRYLSDARFWYFGTGDRNQFSRVITDRWEGPGHITATPKPVLGNVYPGSVRTPNTYGTHMFERTDYIRLKDVTVSYTLPISVIQRFGMDNVRIFARGTNLYTWTDYNGADPEFTGTDFGTYPQGTSITLGINTSF